MSVGKKSIVAVIVPTYGNLHIVVHSVRNAASTLKRNGVKPVFVVCYSKAMDKQVRASLRALGEDIRFLRTGPNARIGNSMIAGIDYANKNTKAVVATMLPEDFVFEAKESLFKTVRPALEGRHDFVNSSWPSNDPVYAMSFPKPQYLNEITVSRLVTFANPGFKPTEMNFMAALKQAEREGKLLHTYSGLLSVRMKEWPKIRQAMKTVLKGKAKVINIWAFEVAIMLGAMCAGKRIGIVPAERLYEHDWPTAEIIQGMREKRLMQFDVATQVIRKFLENTGQHYKLPLFDQVVGQAKKRIMGVKYKSSPAWAEAYLRLKRMKKSKRFSERYPAIRKRK